MTKDKLITRLRKLADALERGLFSFANNESETEEVDPIIEDLIDEIERRVT
jgi:hypothetical protein